MHKFILSCLLLFLVPLSAQAQESLQDKIRETRGKVLPALVNLEVVQRSGSTGSRGRQISGGSGVIVSPQGHILTNYHVARDTVRIKATLNNGKSYRAVVVAHDYPTDLSVLKLETTESLPFVPLESEQLPEVGTYVLAMGNPLMLSSSVTLGVVSNTQRVVSPNNGIRELDFGVGKVAGLYTRWVQHDALILPGNSGGPLVNLQGKVVGINQLGGRGLGFAIPSTLCAQVLKQVRENGRVIRGHLGIRVIPVNKLGRTSGVLVSHVEPGGPADLAGISPGDVLLTLNGRELKAVHYRDLPDFYQSVAAHAPGKGLTIKYIRGTNEHSTKATVEELKFNPESEVATLGATVRELTKRERLGVGLGERDGLLITELRDGFPLANAKQALRVGDVLLSVNHVPTPTVKALTGSTKDLNGEFVLTVFRKGKTLMSVAKTDPQEQVKVAGPRELPKAWLGVGFQPLEAHVARALGEMDLKGVVVTMLPPDGPARKAGLKEGDIIVSMQDQLVSSETTVFLDLVASFDPGTRVKLGLFRPGKGSVHKELVLGEFPREVESLETRRSLSLDLVVRPLGDIDRLRSPVLSGRKGLMVARVSRGGWAALAGLRDGDLLEKLNDEPLDSLESFVALDEHLKKEKPQRVTLQVRRGARTHILFVEPSWDIAKGGKV